MNPTSSAEPIAVEQRRLLLLGLLAVFALHRAAVQLFAGHDLYMDEAQYWYWSQFLDWGYYSKPPGVAVVIAATTAVCGDMEACVRAGSLLLHPLTALVIYALGRRLFDARVAFWGALAYFLMPSIALSSQIITTDVPLLFCWGMGMVAFAGALKDNRWSQWLLLGLALGLGLQSKYTMAAFIASLGLFLLSDATLRKQLGNPRLYVALALGFALLAPNLVWNAQNDFPTLRHTASISQLGQGDSGLKPGRLLDFVGEQFLMAGPVLFAALIVGAVLLRRQWQDQGIRFLALFTLPLLLAICVQALLAKANGNWAAPSYVAGSLWAAALLIRAGRRKLLIAAFALNVLIGGVVLHYDQIARALDITLKRGNDPYWALRGWRESGAVMSKLRSDHPDTRVLFDQRDVMAQLTYYMRPHPLDAVMWDFDGHLDNHFELATRIEPGDGKWFYVTRGNALPEEMARRFNAATAIGDFRVRPPIGEERAFRVFILEGFKS